MCVCLYFFIQKSKSINMAWWSLFQVESVERLLMRQGIWPPTESPEWGWDDDPAAFAAKPHLPDTTDTRGLRGLACKGGNNSLAKGKPKASLS